MSLGLLETRMPDHNGDHEADPEVSEAKLGRGKGEPRDREPEDDDDDLSLSDLPKAVRQRVEAFIPKLVKRTFAAGMGAVFTTEEGIRRLTKEMTLPKEVAGYLVDTASSTKDEVMDTISREVREFLGSVNLTDEIAKILTTLSLEVTTEIRFVPNSKKLGGVEPDVDAKVSLARRPRRRGRLRRQRPVAPERPRGESEDDG